VLKGLVGGDWFDAEQKGGTGSFQLQGTFNVMITSNARLSALGNKYTDVLLLPLQR
jgi:hypothetical protein